MPKRKAKTADDGPGNDWLVTFSDCMTLLLTFFVMLLSFSSFDPTTLNRVLGAIKAPSQKSLFETRRLRREGPVPDVREADQTEDGSEKPDLDQVEPTEKPRDPLEALAADAYRDRRILTVPSEMLFLGRTNLLTKHARQMLSLIADYLRLVKCRVIVTETVSSPEMQDRALARTCAIVAYLTDREGLVADRFGIAAQTEQGPCRTDFKPAVRIAMLSQKVYP